jgi:hypothetical protein
MLTTYPHLLSRLEMSGAIPPNLTECTQTSLFSVILKHATAQKLNLLYTRVILEIRNFCLTQAGRQTDRQTDRQTRTVWRKNNSAACERQQVFRDTKCAARFLFFVFITLDHFRNTFYCSLQSNQLQRRYTEAGPGSLWIYRNYKNNPM